MGALDMDEHRVNLLEQRMEATIHRVDSKLDNIAEALQSLVRIEERQIQVGKSLDAFGSEVREQESRLRRLEVALPENIGKRLNTLEAAMPGLLESRKWIVTGVMACVGIIGVAVVHLVMKG